MSTVSALVTAIENDVSDRTPRLVFADWVQERGYESDAARIRESDYSHPFEALSVDCWCEVMADFGTISARAIDLDLFHRCGFNQPDRLTDRGLLRLATVRAPALIWLDVSKPYTASADVEVVVALSAR